MVITEIAPGLTVAGQPTSQDIAGFGPAGFALLINNRPNGEEAGQPGSTPSGPRPRAPASPTGTCR